MSRRPAKVTQADVARALRAAEQCHTPHVVEIAPDGTIRIFPAANDARPKTLKPVDDDEPIEL